MTQEQLEKAYAVVRQFALDFFHGRHDQLKELIPGVDIRPSPLTDDEILNMPVVHHWLFMAQAAIGQVELTNDAAVRIFETCQELADLVFNVPGYGRGEVPDWWAEMEIGGLWWRAFVWSQGDELITIKEAAAMASVSEAAIGQRKTLRKFIDPLAPARQGRRLVRRADVLRLYKI